MIIDDRHRFVFVHIPKCAGTSVRQVLKQFDSYEGRWANAKREHPELGRLLLRQSLFEIQTTILNELIFL